MLLAQSHRDRTDEDWLRFAALATWVRASIWAEDAPSLYDFTPWLKPKSAAELEAERQRDLWDEVWAMLAQDPDEASH